jgi:hypothetical protein
VKLARAIAVFLLTLSLSLGSAVSVSLATEQAFMKPCMERMNDCPCCKDHCDSAIMSCSVQCPVPPGAAILLDRTQLNGMAVIQLLAFDSYPGSQFAAGPPAPIPI